MAGRPGITRRSFLTRTTQTTAALGLGSWLANGVSKAIAAPAPRALGANERLVLGLIGSGGQGQHDLATCLRGPNTVCAALCDVAEFRLKEGSATATSTMEKAGLTAVKLDRYDDYRRLLDRRDIDAVIIATPDHWHTKPFVDACAAGKHIYQEKPFCYSIDAGKQMLAAAEANAGAIIQIGMQRRSGTHYPKAKELLDSGKLGEVKYVRAFDCRNYVSAPDPFAPRPVEGRIDWDKFQEPCAHKVAYDPWRYFAWRWFWDYAGGLVTDVGVHVMDVVHWLTGKSTPKSAVCHGGVYSLKYWETPDVVNAVWDYGTHTVVFTGNFTNGYEGDGLTLYCTKGTLDIRGTYIRVYDESRKDKPFAEFGPEGPEHQHNWLDCIRTGSRPNAPAEIGFSSLLPSLLANLAYREGTKVTWDPNTRTAKTA